MKRFHSSYSRTEKRPERKRVGMVGVSSLFSGCFIGLHELETNTNKKIEIQLNFMCIVYIYTKILRKYWQTKDNSALKNRDNMRSIPEWKVGFKNFLNSFISAHNQI